MSDAGRRRLLHYGLALVAVLVATGVRGWTDPFLGDSSPYTIYYAAVAVAAWQGGLEPALLALLLSALAADFFFIPPRGSLYLWDLVSYTPQAQVQLVLFLLVSAMIAFLSESLHASRRRAELTQRQLELSEERYRTVADFTYNWEYWIIPGGTLLYVSPSCQRITGYAAEEFLADSHLLEEIVHPEDREWVSRHIREMHPGCEPCHLEFRIVTRQGQIRWIDHTCAPVHAQDGGFLGRRVSNCDATTRIEAERALRENQQRLALTQQIGRIGCFDADILTGRIVWTAELEEIFGLAPGSFEGSYEAYTRRLHPEDLVWLEPFMQQWYVTGPPEQNWECRFYRADGELRWMAVRARLLYDNGGRAVRRIGAVLDITDQRRLEAELRQAKEAAETANRAKDRFVAHVSHELRTPLSAILGLTELALGEPLSPTVQDYLRTTQDSAEALLRILNELLDYARLRSGEFALEAVPFRLRTTVTETVKLFSGAAAMKGLSLRCEVDDALPNAWVGDPLRLRQMLANLLGNALKFTPRGGVSVRVQPHVASNAAGPLEFIVSDTGIGISPQDQPRIFAPFAQAECSTARTHGGSGLGLAIVRDLAAQMGGQVWLESQPGQGSRFHFTVQLTPAAELEETAPAPSPPPEPVSLPPLTILLAEDNPANQKLTCYLLRKYGHTVEVASDGLQALDLLAQHTFDLVLMDVQMPGLDGLEATARIRALPDPVRAHLPIVAMTAYAMPEDLKRCLAAGMDGYLPKPIDTGHLLATLQRLVPHPPSVPQASLDGAPSCRQDLPASSPAEVFDRDTALQRCFGDSGLFQNLADCFACDAEPLLAELAAACQRGDTETLGRLVHRLKGTLGFLGTPATLECARQLETFCQAGDLDAAASALTAVRAQVLRLREALLRHAKNALT